MSSRMSRTGQPVLEQSSSGSKTLLLSREVRRQRADLNLPDRTFELKALALLLWCRDIGHWGLLERGADPQCHQEGPCDIPLPKGPSTSRVNCVCLQTPTPHCNMLLATNTRGCLEFHWHSRTCQNSSVRIDRKCLGITDMDANSCA